MSVLVDYFIQKKPSIIKLLIKVTTKIMSFKPFLLPFNYLLILVLFWKFMILNLDLMLVYCFHL